MYKGVYSVSEIIITNELGDVVVTTEVLARIVGNAAIECYGIVGMCSRHRIKDSFVELLGRDNLSRGVSVLLEDDAIVVDIYIIVGYGTKISEVAHNIMNRVKYVVESMVGVKVTAVNINVEGVRVS